MYLSLKKLLMQHLTCFCFDSSVKSVDGNCAQSFIFANLQSLRNQYNKIEVPALAFCLCQCHYEFLD